MFKIQNDLSKDILTLNVKGIIIIDPTIHAFSGFNDEITEQLEILDKKDVRIILGNFNETWAR